MKDEQYKKAVELFEEAMDLDKEARHAYLDRTCKEDPELREYVERMLAEDQADEDAFEESNLHMGHELLADALGVGTNAPVSDDSATTISLPHSEQIGRYRIMEKIGEGGMGAVYLAEQDHPQRRVALKMIRPGIFSTSLRKRFKFEAEILGKLQHPGIAQIHEAGEFESEHGPLPYFAMEYIQGIDLKKYVKEHDLSVRARLELVARIADAVHHAHQQGIVHRDLKPENVLVMDLAITSLGKSDTEFVDLGQPKILDFGVARATDADIQLTTMQTDVGQLVGTLPYMSPEQVAGDSRALDTRSDIYALGVLLYELLSGRPPFNLRNKPIPEAARIIREEEPTRLGSIDTAFKGDIDTISLKALEKDRNRRYGSAADLASDLRRYLANEPIIAHPPSTFYQLKKFAQRNKGLVAGLALTLLVLIAGIIVSLSLTFRALQGERRAEAGEETAERNAHRLNLTAAQAVGEQDSLRALAHLEAVPPDHRDWEWRHLNACFDSHIAEYRGDTVIGYSPMISPGSGSRLLAAMQRKGEIEVLDLASGEVQAVFSAEEKLINPSLAPDGSHLSALADDGRAVHIWNVKTRKLLFRIPTHEGTFYSSFFSPRGKRLVACVETAPDIIIDTETGRSETIPEQVLSESATGAFTSDGSHLIANPAGGVIVLYSLEEKSVLVTGYCPEHVRSLAICPNAPYVALGDGQRSIRILNSSTLEETHIFRGHNHVVYGVAFSKDGRHLASASLDNTIRVWDIATGETSRVLGWMPEASVVTSLSFSEDGDLLAMGNTSAVRLWKWRDDARHVLEGHGDYVYHVAFHPDGSLIASGTYANLTMFIWDAITHELMGSIPHALGRHSLGFTPDGNRLVGHHRPVGKQIKLSVWDPWTLRLLNESRGEEDTTLFKTVESQNLHPGTGYFRIVAGGSKATPVVGEVLSSSADRSVALRLLEEAEPPYEDSDRYRTLFLCDIETGQRIREIGKHDTHITATAFSPDGTRIVSGDYLGGIKVWNAAGGPALATLKGHPHEVFSLAFHPDGTRFASGGNDSSIIVWDAHTFEQVLVLRGHNSYVHSLAFSPDGTQLVSGSGDHTVRIWDSVPPAKRWNQIRALEAQRREAEPLVDRLLTELGDPLDVSDALRRDPTLSDDQRGAALWVLLKRSSSEKR